MSKNKIALLFISGSVMFITLFGGILFDQMGFGTGFLVGVSAIAFFQELFG